jgi:hypothetical protein
MYTSWNFQKIVYYGALTFVVALILGWFFVDGNPELHKDKAQNWALPKKIVFNPEEALATISEKNLFGKDPIVQEAPEGETQKEPVVEKKGWKAIGAIKSGEIPSVIIEDMDAEKVLYLKKGELLPDGQEITHISKDKFSYLTEKKEKKEIYFYIQPEPETN